MNNTILAKALIIITSIIFAGCNNFIVSNPLDEDHQYNEFLGHHYNECKNNELGLQVATGLLIESNINYELSRFSAIVDNCSDLNLVSIEYTYINDFTVSASSAPMAEGIERIVYRVHPATEHLSSIALRENGFNNAGIGYIFITM